MRFVALFPVIAFFGVASVFACATSVNNNPSGNNGGEGGVEGGAGEGGEPVDTTVHALGVITLGESHVAGASTSAPIVSAVFMPTSEAAAGAACGEEIDGCKIAVKPDCSDGLDSGTTTCGADEVCVLDEECNSYCEAVPSCSPTCDPVDEECKLVGLTSKCVARPDFNAGIITINGEGVTKTITMRPPYRKYTPTQGDSAISATGGAIKVAATGATDFGFDAFTDNDFTATSLIQTSPALETLTDSDIFDSTSVPVGWKPSKDTSKGDKVHVTLAADKGVAVCEVDDSEGKFEISHKVVKKIHDAANTGTSATISVARVRTEVRKDKKTVVKDAGETSSSKDNEPIPSIGYLNLVTTSVETFTIQGCPTGYKRCDNGGTTPQCVFVTGSDRFNCGDCNKTCLSSQYCSSGTCF